MEKKSFQEPDTIDYSIINGIVAGKQEIIINDFNKDIRCPICGEMMKIKGVNFDMESYNEDYIQHTYSFSDDIGQLHSYKFGRTKLTEEREVNMCCPNKCIKDMIVAVKYLTYSPYKQL